MRRGLAYGVDVETWVERDVLASLSASAFTMSEALWVDRTLHSPNCC